MEKTQVIKEELIPVVSKLQSEGIDVYTYTCQSKQGRFVDSLYWYDVRTGRILNIQPDYFWGYNLGVSYIPSSANGSGCRLNDNNDGVDADSILQYRNKPTWVHGIKNYSSMEDFLSRETVLIFYKLDMIENS